MDRVQGINTDRLEWCCEEYGITPQGLAKETKIAERTLERLMDGEDVLSVNQLEKLSGYFNRGMLFFLETGSVSAEQIHTPQFRTIANQKQFLSNKVRAIIERAERQRDTYLSLREELDEDERLSFDPPKIPRGNVARAASITREWLDLTSNNDFGTYREAIEAKGALVFLTSGYGGAWQIPKDDPVIGFSLHHEICPVIVVKKHTLSEARQTFTLMHELGHLLLHRESHIVDEGDIAYGDGGDEQQANAFAGLLLVPDSFLRDVNDRNKPDNVSEYDTWLNPQRNSCGVSVEVILRRLLDAGRLSNAEYKAYRKWRATLRIDQDGGGTREWRHREPKHLFGDTYVHTVLDALSANHITLNKASSYLDNLKIKDLHQLAGYYASI